MSKQGKIKTFVLDTNVLLHSGSSIESFQDNDVVIPMTVIEELDKFKKNSDELGRNARLVIRMLDRLRKSSDTPGLLTKGAPLSVVSKVATGKLYVIASLQGEIISDENNILGYEFQDDSPDNRILKVAYQLKKAGKRVIFISKDINLRLKADALGLKVMDFEREKVDNTTLYKGFSTQVVTPETLAKVYNSKEFVDGNNLSYPNEFKILTSAPNDTNYSIVRKIDNNKYKLLDNLTTPIWNIMPRNKEQQMALELLLDPSIKLITLVGGAGTGKTLLAIAAALHQVVTKENYDKILVSRPIIPLGNDIGYLPGSKNNKLSGWMQPIFDNLEFLLGKNSDSQKSKSSSKVTIDSLMNSHKLELEALTYIRGRSIPRQFVIIDEAQNLTPHEIKTIVSRCGDDTKMVLTGDPGQIDNPYLDASSNGLSFAVERMKGQEIFGHVTLGRSERSKLAALASKLL
jgi:PhoH-like ATPase